MHTGCVHHKICLVQDGRCAIVFNITVVATFFLFGRQVVAIVALTPHTDIQTQLELARIDAPTIEFEQRVYVCVYLRIESRLRDYACSINGAASSQGKRYKQASKQTNIRACVHSSSFVMLQGKDDVDKDENPMR